MGDKILTEMERQIAEMFSTTNDFRLQTFI